MTTAEPLGPNLKIFVSNEHTFGTDAVLLSNFAQKTEGLACDLGTGCGIIPFLLVRGGFRGKITGVEISKSACLMAEKSIEAAGLEDYISIENADLRNLRGRLPLGEFSLVTCNPPYKAAGAGIESKRESDRLARHETACTLFDIVSAAAALLRTGGSFCLCQRPERLADVLVCLRENNLEPKRLRLVAARAGREPWLLLIEGRRGGKPGMRILPTLYTQDDNGNLSPEMLEIYGDYKEGRK